MNNELKSTIDFNLIKYGPLIERRKGLDRGDLLSEVRECIWKGLVTFKSNGTANIKTYLNHCVNNRFKTLARLSQTRKATSLDYHENVYETAGVSEEATYDNGESHYASVEQSERTLVELPAFERMIFGDILQGRTLEEIGTNHTLPRSKVITAVKHIHSVISRLMREEDEETL